MKMTKVALAGVAAAFLLGGVGAAVAKPVKYRPLKVTPKPMAKPMSPGEAVGGALAAPFNAVGAVGGPIGVAGAVAGGAVAGAATIAFAPLAGLSGAPVGISAVPAPPLPIAARYARTGKVTSTYDEGYAQDVPVDASGPIYKLNYKEEGVRTVTPFSLIAFPVTAATSVITAPLRAATP